MVSSETEVTEEKEAEDDHNETSEDSNGDSVGKPRSGDEEDTEPSADQAPHTSDEEEAGERVRFVTTACGDYHNLAIDSSGDTP